MEPRPPCFKPPENDTKKLQTLQFIFTVVTALVTGIWGYFIHAAQEKNNEAQVAIKHQQVKLQEMQHKWQQSFQAMQAEFQKTQLQSQEQIAKNISRLNSVTAMNPLIDKITEADPAKAKMAAYGLYLLNLDMPEMAVIFIAASKRPEMEEVLETLGKMDAKIIEYVGKFVSASEQIGATHRLDRVMQKIQTSNHGYCFFGQFNEGQWAKKAITSNLPKGLPQINEKYIVHRQTYLRASFPVEGEDGILNLGVVRGVNSVANEFRILDVRQYSNGSVWCKIEILTTE